MTKSEFVIPSFVISWIATMIALSADIYFIDIRVARIIVNKVLFFSFFSLLFTMFIYKFFLTKMYFNIKDITPVLDDFSWSRSTIEQRIFFVSAMVVGPLMGIVLGALFASSFLEKIA